MDHAIRGCSRLSRLHGSVLVALTMAPAITNSELCESECFFAPVESDLVDSLLAQYRSARSRIEAVSLIATSDEYAHVMHYFLEGNVPPERRYGVRSPESVFACSGAIAALNSAYWSKTLATTDVLNLMPQKRRDEWDKSITDHDTPEFAEKTVRDTLTNLLGMRPRFLAEKVDGVFRSLSGVHVTNSPTGFNRRMILNHAYSEYGNVNHSVAGVIGDLRAVIARFMGRDEPRWDSTTERLRALRALGTGQWQNFDGGALRIRVYLKGTAHLEVHPDMSWRLNQVLAFLHPLAIPSELRKKPTKRAKHFALIQRPLPFEVLNVIAAMRKKNATRIDFAYDADKQAVQFAEAVRVLKSIGGAVDKTGCSFDYSPDKTINELLSSGCMPDQVSHQFYPTPENLAQIAAEMADIQPTHTVLEPSAGNGDLASFLPTDRTTCVEISDLRCSILKSRGLNVVHGDFLAWKPNVTSFDRIVMNPPFSDGRAEAHLKHAFSLLKQGGRLVAVLPASMRGKAVLAGNLTWSSVHAGEFAGTSVSVVILTTVRGIE